MDVNGYISPLYAGKQANVVKKGGDSNLGMDDFLKLLAAQLANQDMMNPSQDTDFIAQMAQFSSLQSMDAMAKMTSFNQSTSLVGKYVVVATYERGKLVKAEGIVEKVNLFGYEPTIVVNGKEYTYANVMEIKNASEVKPNSPTALKNEIIAAQENKTSAKVSENGSDIHHTEKWVTQEQMNAYEMAIEKAQATMDKASITEKEIALAIAEIALATETFNTAKKDGTYGLEQSIPEVEGGE